MVKIKGKTKQEKFEYLNLLRYPVLVKEKANKFYLVIPELSLVAVSDSLEVAYRDLREQKKKLFNEILDCEAEDGLMLPQKTHRASEITAQLKIFIYKVLIICLLLGITFVFGTAAIIDKITGISWVDIGKKTANTVVLEAEEFSLVPEDIKEARVKKFRQFLDGIRPFIREFQEAFSSSSPEEKE